ncbi:phospholipase D-like domain-containing protein, partial [Corallococcus exiguus]
FQLTGQVGSRGAGFASALYQTTGVRMEPRNRIRWANNGAVFDVMVEEIGRARASIHIVMFIWRPGRASDRMIEALAERARAGVHCRVLVDPLGSGPFETEVKPRLEAAGCEAHLFRPLPADENLARNHRKILVVDGKVAVTGGLAIQDEWLGDARNEKEWRDTNVRVQGPVVAQLQQAFAENWQESTGELLPQTDFPTLSVDQPGLDAAGEGWAAFVSSTANPEVTRAERLTQLMVKAAKKRLWISQAYFTPNDALTALLVEKARAGVDVRVLAPGDKNDQRAITLLQRQSYDTLRAAGVRLWEYQPSMMHAKTMLVDDRLILVGSINYDALSFNLLEEGSLVLEDVEAARQLEVIFLDDLTKAREVQAERAGR